MNIITKTTNHVLTDEMRALIDKQFLPIERFLHADPTAQLTVEVEGMPQAEKDGARYRVEANLTIGGTLYRAEARAATLESEIGRAHV